ncbi:MAG TPA: alpha/beta hydrolase [Candidatus Limnocylindrales bacterium]|jgi:pimeloyl-ACP methyl ester carboxylesterase|nr:alpha/beta hydrolase [Candidatus Limnocylindrales bacterium]
MAASPGRVVRAPDGTRIADFVSGDGPPLVLVHGAAADHTTFRVVEPILARRRTVHAIDRRGRGASGDGPAYAIDREFEDLAAVVDSLAVDSGSPIDVVGHSYGGRVGLGAALRTPNIRRLVVYEGAPAPPEAPYQEPELQSRLQSLADAGRNEELLVTFLSEVVGMSAADLGAYRANPVWPARVAAARTIVREVAAETSAAAGLDALGRVTVPVLQVLGGASRQVFRAATEALDARLANGRIAVIDGAKHGAHHTHPDRLVAEVESFLAAP